MKILINVLLGIAVALLLLTSFSLFTVLREYYAKKETAVSVPAEPCAHLEYMDDVVATSGFHKGATGKARELTEADGDDSGKNTLVKIVNAELKGINFEYIYLYCSTVEVVK